MKRITLLTFLISLLLLTACKHWWKGADDEDDSPFQGMTAEQIYTEAQDYFHKNLYSEAIKRYEALDTLYPFNDHAEEAELALIYAYYKKEDYASAAATAEPVSACRPSSSWPLLRAAGPSGFGRWCASAGPVPAGPAGAGPRDSSRSPSAA